MTRERGPTGPAPLLACRWSHAVIGCRPHKSEANVAVDPSNPFLSNLHYHLPNFVLAALMYTLLGRVLLSLVVDPASKNYIWRFFCRITDPFVAVIAVVTPKAVPPIVLWLLGVVWLFWLRVGLLYLFLLLGLMPKAG